MSTIGRRDFLTRAGAGALALAAARRSTGQSARDLPNILYIICDDLGYGDVQCLNPEHGKIPTPHLDRLASQGLVFTDCHGGSAVCTPTRYGVLTGRYCWRTRLQQGVLDSDTEPLIAPGRLTVPGLLRRHGYTTAAVGKWHLGYTFAREAGEAGGRAVGVGTRLVGGPTTRGFDSFYGFSHARAIQWLVTDDKIAEKVEAVDMLGLLTTRVKEYLARARQAGRPFFCYWALNSPHTPIVPTPAWQGKSGLNAYADFVMQTDAAIGEVLAALQSEGLADNTLVVFTSDNGCSPAARIEELRRAGHEPSAQYRGYKADIWDGGHRIPFLVRWPGKVRAGGRSDQLLCLGDLLATAADLVGTKLPANAGEDSFSFLGHLLGTGVSARRNLIHHSIQGRFAIREANWKLELCAGSGGWGSPNEQAARREGLPGVQLYDLAHDVGEQHNVQAQHPETVQRLTKLLVQQVAAGRSTPGQPQANDREIDVYKDGRRGQTNRNDPQANAKE